MTYDVMADFRNVFGLLDPQPTSNLTPSMQFSWLRIYILGGIVTCMVQLFYAYHLNLLQHPRMVIAAIVVMAFIQCCGSIVAGALQAKYNFYMTALQPEVPIGNYIFGTANVICSIIVSFVMTRQLMWKDAQWKSKHPLLPKFIRITVETGTVAAMAAVTYFVLFFCQVHALSLMIPALVLSKIYANSLLVVFNSRVNIIRGRIFVPEAIDPLVFPPMITKGSTIPHYNIGELTTKVGTETSSVTIDLTTSCVSRRDSIHVSVADHTRSTA